MRANACFLLLILLLGLLLPGGLPAAHEVMGEGVVRPVGMPRPADEAKARELALRDAYKKAGEAIITDSAALQLYLARVEALTREELEKGIESVENAAPPARRRGYLRLRLDVSFKDGYLEELSGAEKSSTLQEIQERRFMVIIPEVHIGRPVPDPAGETEINRKLIEAKFRVFDPKQVAKIRETDLAKAEIKGASPVELLSIAKREGCDYLIVGEAFSHELPRNPNVPTNLRACQARVEARLFAVDTGEIITTHGLEATEMAASELIAGKAALRSAGGKVADYFIQQIYKRMESEEGSQNRVELVLGGVTFKMKERFAELLQGLGEDVTEVRETSWENESAVFEVKTYLRSNELVSAIFRAAEKENLGLEPNSTSAGRTVWRLYDKSDPKEIPPSTVPVEVNPPRIPSDAAPLDPTQLASVQQQRWIALIIGLNDYGMSDGAIPSLTTARNDAADLATVLRDKYRFEVRTLTDREATISGIQKTFEKLAADLTPNDNVLIYYAGHGHILPASSLGLWIVADSKEQTDGVYNAQIKEFIRRLKARRVILVSDSCYSGDFVRRAVGRPRTETVTSAPEVVLQISAKIAGNGNPAREVITSGNLAPVPDTSADGFCAGHSPFACALLNALEQVPTGGAISTTDLFAAIYRRMEKTEGFKPDEGPQKGALPGHQDGEFFLVRFRP
ncbi:hypothetical protein GC173_03910 [bacterium]|nr:hypothetical protein [bacterium]